MLDEALPTYVLKGSQHQRWFHVTQYGNDPEPAYALLGTDPQSPLPSHKNCYAAALFDAFNQEVLFGEVLARPNWLQPTLSPEESRRSGGVPPPPQPALPHEFTIQLYNPDQQIRVEVHSGKWVGSDSYEFSMPQSTFRVPSASSLDRGQSDPASLAITPKINFVWRKESKLSKDLTCFATGKSTDVHEKKRSRKDPDVAIALWRSMRELTIYEPNASRFEMEDPKGLEIVLLLSAVVIKDLFFGSREHLREFFNIADAHADRRPHRLSQAILQPQTTNQDSLAGHASRESVTRPPAGAPPLPSATGRPVPPPPLADPLSQWELDAETARLKAQAEAEAAEFRRQKREREKAEEAERRRLQRMVEDEERQEAQRRQAEVDLETERLRKQYGVEPDIDRPVDPARRSRLRKDGKQSSHDFSDAHLIRPAASASSFMMSGANGSGASSSSIHLSKPAKKKSFFGLRNIDSESP